MSFFDFPSSASSSKPKQNLKIKKRIVAASTSSSNSSHSQEQRRKLEEDLVRKRTEERKYRDREERRAEKEREAERARRSASSPIKPSLNRTPKNKRKIDDFISDDEEAARSRASPSKSASKNKSTLAAKRRLMHDESDGSESTSKSRSNSPAVGFKVRKSRTSTPLSATRSWNPYSLVNTSEEENGGMNDDGSPSKSILTEKIKNKKKIDISLPIAALDREEYVTPGTGATEAAGGEEKQSQGRNFFDLHSLRGEHGEEQEKWIGKIDSEEIVVGNQKAYVPYFLQDGFANDMEDLSRLPKVDLAYPAKGCHETFILLQPKTNSDYAPIPELFRTIGLLVTTFVPPAYLPQFGQIPSADTVFSSNTASLGHTAIPAVSSPAPSTPGSPTKEYPRYITSTPSNVVPATNADEEPIVRALHKAFNRRDGPAFVRAIHRFNAMFTAIRESGDMEAYLSTGEAAKKIKIEEWDQMAVFVGEQVYQRVVGPSTESLKHYQPFSDNVYGELLPRFVTEIVRRHGLGKDSVFVDLGSGVGNALIGVALLSGSASYGCESMPNPAKLATTQIAEAKRRWAMWALKGNETCEAYEGDFCTDRETSAALKQADLVLVNNYAFTPTLNDQLSWLFLDLKEGAKVISLKPFLPRDFRLTERTANGPLAVLKMKERSYPRNSVSWTDEGGRYYEHTIDRSAVQKFFSGEGRQTRR